MPRHKKYDGTFRVVGETSMNKHYPIRPEHIQEHLSGTFGKAEVEWRAEKLIAFFKSRGYWCSFTREELNRFYESNGWETHGVFFGLMGAWLDDGASIMDWVEPADVFFAATESDVYFVTDRFIDRCANAIRPNETTSDRDARHEGHA